MKLTLADNKGVSYFVGILRLAESISPDKNTKPWRWKITWEQVKLNKLEWNLMVFELYLTWVRRRRGDFRLGFKAFGVQSCVWHSEKTARHLGSDNNEPGVGGTFLSTNCSYIVANSSRQLAANFIFLFWLKTYSQPRFGAFIKFYS